MKLLQQMKYTINRKLITSKTASFCDFFLEGKERNEVIEF